MFFEVGDDNVLAIYASEAAVLADCEALDVENGDYQFFDDAGQSLKPEFTVPNEHGNSLGIIPWVISGEYRLVRTRRSVTNLEEILPSLAGIEENPYFSNMADVQV